MLSIHSQLLFTLNFLIPCPRDGFRMSTSTGDPHSGGSLRWKESIRMKRKEIIGVSNQEGCISKMKGYLRYGNAWAIHRQ